MAQPLRQSAGAPRYRSILPITHSIKVDAREVLALTFQGSAL
jgi:hypothetical protein